MGRPPVDYRGRSIGAVSEIQEVLAAIAAMAERNEPMALATIVATRGSTYRRAGARYLVPATGEPIGNLSGGCLEDDVARRPRGDVERRAAADDLRHDRRWRGDLGLWPRLQRGD